MKGKGFSITILEEGRIAPNEMADVLGGAANVANMLALLPYNPRPICSGTYRNNFCLWYTFCGGNGTYKDCIPDGPFETCGNYIDIHY